MLDRLSLVERQRLVEDRAVERLREYADVSRAETAKRRFVVGIGIVAGLLLLGDVLPVESLALTLIVTMSIRVPFRIWQGACQAVAYYDLRALKEGTAIDELVSVFT